MVDVYNDPDGEPRTLGRVASVDAWTESRTYRRPFGISSGTSGELLTVLVQVTDDQERVGLGEAAPMTAYTGELPAGIRAAIEQLTPSLLGREATDVAAAHLAMDSGLRGQRLAKGSLDIALHDLLARALGVPVHTLLGGAVRDHVPLAWVVGLGEIDEVVREAVEHAARGFAHVKVKGGLDAKRDILLAQELRSALPQHVEISVDANEAYEHSTALDTLLQLQDAGVALVEQPLPAWDLDGMTRLTGALHLQIMADESVQTMHDALAVVRRQAADVVNVKVLKVGGLYRALQVAAVASAAGLAIKVGSMPELGVATLAGVHLAATLPQATVPADLIGPLMVDKDPIDGPTFDAAWNGWIPVPRTPGLGPFGLSEESLRIRRS